MCACNLVLTANLESYMLPCLTKQLLGFDCPGCGLQRALVYFFKGNFAEAFFMYPAIYALLPLAIMLVVNKLFNIKYGGQTVIALSILSVAAIVINYIIKLTQIL